MGCRGGTGTDGCVVVGERRGECRRARHLDGAVEDHAALRIADAVSLAGAPRTDAGAGGRAAPGVAGLGAPALRPRLLRQRLTASGSAVKRFMDVVTPLAKSERWYSGTFRGGPCWYAEPASRLAAFAADFRQP